MKFRHRTSYVIKYYYINIKNVSVSSDQFIINSQLLQMISSKLINFIGDIFIIIFIDGVSDRISEPFTFGMK